MAGSYYDFGYQTAWAAEPGMGPGGIRGTSRAGTTRQLGGEDYAENQGPLHFAPFARSVGDWPALRAAGPEPLDPVMDPRQKKRLTELGCWPQGGGQSNLLGLVLAFGAGWLLSRK